MSSTPSRAVSVRTVLVVEDEPSLCSIVADLLEEDGYLVLTAHDAEEALDLAHRHSGNIDLLLTDVMIGIGGGLSGRELTDVLLRERPGLRVLYVSGHEQRAALTGDGPLPPGQSFLHKPYAADDLTEQVRRLLSTRSIR
jgi:two-component system cell cycle sensor histidine kinase/response regulator CckA